MSFREYWRDRIRESFMNAYLRAQAIGFILLLPVAVLLWIWPLFPYDKAIVTVTACWFFLALVKEICFVSPYRNAAKLQSELDTHAKQVLDKAFELLKRPESQLQPFQALYAAGAADLETNEQLMWVADRSSEHHEHPTRWLEKYVRQEEWLSYFQWGKRHPDFKFEEGADYLKALVRWAVEHNRGTEESISKEILQGMIKLEQQTN